MRAAPSHPPSTPSTAPRGVAAWWHALPQPVRTPAWPGLLGVLAILALLLGFHQVVRGAVEQGELLKQSVANRAEAVWRCNALKRASVRATCLAQIDAPAVRADAVPPPNTAALAAVGSGS